MATTIDARPTSAAGGRKRPRSAGDAPDARRPVRSSVAISAVRCVLSYLVIPGLAPVVGWLGGLATPVSLVLSLVATGFAVTGLRRVRRTGRDARGYTVFVVLVLVALGLVIGFDVRELLG